MEDFFSDFHFTDQCITFGKIQRVSIIESSNDSWNIDFIVTQVRDSGIMVSRVASIGSSCGSLTSFVAMMFSLWAFYILPVA